MAPELSSDLCLAPLQSDTLAGAHPWQLHATDTRQHCRTSAKRGPPTMQGRLEKQQQALAAAQEAAAEARIEANDARTAAATAEAARQVLTD